MRLKGKRALVTGGAAGIGYAIVERFLQEGAAVAFCDINAEGCSRAVAQLSGKGKVKGIVGDVAKSSDAQRIVEQAAAFLGGLDILVNNAGIEIQRPILDTSDEDWERQMAVNAGGVYRMSKFAVPVLIKAGGGSIVNIGSIAGFLGFKSLGGYGASKSAMAQFTRHMASEFAEHKIRVNSVNPGVVDTPMMEASARALAPPGVDWREVTEMFLGRQLIRRPGSAAEIAYAVLFFVDDEAGFITGTDLTVDGGFTVS